MTDLTTALSDLLVETHKSSAITPLADHQRMLDKFLIDAKEIVRYKQLFTQSSSSRADMW